MNRPTPGLHPALGLLLTTCAVGALGCSGVLVGGTPTFSVVPKYRAPIGKPLAPGARVELALWSDERNNFVGPSIPPVENVRGTTTDAAVATFGQLHDMGYTDGWGKDITGKGITAVGPGSAEVCILGDLIRGEHEECLSVEVRAATWTYRHEGEPLVGDLQVPHGEKVRLTLHAEDVDGETLAAFGAYFDDDFGWASTAKQPMQVSGFAVCDRRELKLAKSEHRVKCIHP